MFSSATAVLQPEEMPWVDPYVRAENAFVESSELLHFIFLTIENQNIIDTAD